jgi:5'(3')-deoxyribonucleotidase
MRFGAISILFPVWLTANVFGEVKVMKTIAVMKILYIDMDGVLVDFASGVEQVDEQTRQRFKNNLDEIPGIFSKMQPMKGALEAFNRLSHHFDIYILSTAPWNNPSAWCDKLEWVTHYLGDKAKKRLILTHHKNLNKGHFLVDDRTKNGTDQFEGEHIHFGTKGFPGWTEVTDYLLALK